MLVDTFPRVVVLNAFKPLLGGESILVHNRVNRLIVAVGVALVWLVSPLVKAAAVLPSSLDKPVLLTVAVCARCVIASLAALAFLSFSGSSSVLTLIRPSDFAYLTW